MSISKKYILSIYVIGWETMWTRQGHCSEKASAHEGGGIVEPGGAIPGVQVGGGANVPKVRSWEQR